MYEENQGECSRRESTSLLVLDLDRDKTQPTKHLALLLVNTSKTCSSRLIATYCHLSETAVAVAHEDETVRVWFGSASQETVPLEETLIYL